MLNENSFNFFSFEFGLQIGKKLQWLVIKIKVILATILETLLNHSRRLQVKGSSPVSLATTLNARALIPNRPLPFSFLSSNELLKEKKDLEVFCFHILISSFLHHKC